MRIIATHHGMLQRYMRLVHLEMYNTDTLYAFSFVCLDARFVPGFRFARNLFFPTPDRTGPPSPNRLAIRPVWTLKGEKGHSIPFGTWLHDVV